MTQPPAYETKDVYSNMVDFETKNLPYGYAPAAAPHADRTGTQLQSAEEEAPAEQASETEEKPRQSRRSSSAKNED